MNLSLKPPKLRFRPGQFFRNKSGELLCIVFAYLRVETPGIWHFVLESRKDTGDPSSELSRALEAYSLGSTKVDSKICYRPLRLGEIDSFTSQGYAFGDREHATTQQLLRDYKEIS